MANDLIVTAHQIAAFVDASDGYPHPEISGTVGRTIQYVLNNYPAPVLRPSQPASKAAAERTTRNSSAEPPNYPYNWATDKGDLKRNLEAFEERTGELRQHPEYVQYCSIHFSKTRKSPSADSTVPPASMAFNFLEAQRGDMAAIIAQAITMVNQAALQGPAGQAPRQERPPQFRPRDVGYFEPDPQAAPVEVKETHNIYHNVFSFTNQLRVKVTSIDAATLCQNIESCLLGAADDWYTNQLTHISRIGLRNDPDGVKE